MRHISPSSSYALPTMNIIRPLRMITSALLISLALLTLLVSATPIPYLTYSQDQMPSSAELLAQGQKRAAGRLYDRICEMIHISSHKGSQEDLVRDINEFAGLIAHMTDAEANNVVITNNVFLAINYVKLFVATWHSGEAQQHAVHAIKACEDKAVNKGLPRWVLFFKPPQNLSKFFNKLELRFKNAAANTQANELYDLVTKIFSLTLTEHGTIREQLKKEYNAVQAEINSWQPGDTKIRAEETMEGWKAMDILVDVFCATEATAKV
ncbi:hypothetical protein H0H93_016600 [Arthromyces matolae]|nr:hypothetical protein H0H93_016600 [Arthromyces matolae]